MVVFWVAVYVSYYIDVKLVFDVVFVVVFYFYYCVVDVERCVFVMNGSFFDFFYYGDDGVVDDGCGFFFVCYVVYVFDELYVVVIVFVDFAVC